MFANSAALPPQTPVASTVTYEQACPRSLVGRLIGKHGVTIKGVELFTGSVVEINQQTDPAKVLIIGSMEAVRVAQGMVTDIMSGQFKGFALLRELAADPQAMQTAFVYSPGVGLLPNRQLVGVSPLTSS